MKEDNIDKIREDIIKVKEVYSALLERLNSKIKLLIEKIKSVKTENTELKESLKETNNKITELKIQLTKMNSDLVNKDEEISKLKNLLLNSNIEKTSVQDKENVKSRIKELISRIDVHLNQYEEETDDTKDYD